MAKFWRKRDDLDRKLGAARPRPRQEFVAALASRLTPRVPATRRYSRVAFAMALMVFMAGSFASFGGISYAASGVSGTVQAVKTAVHVSSRAHVRTLSAARDEYGKTKAAVVTKIKPVKVKPIKAKPAATHVAGVHQTVKQGTLPFTGLSLAGTAAFSLLLIGAGLMLRRSERRTE